MSTLDRIIGVVIGTALLVFGIALGLSNPHANGWLCLFVMGPLFIFGSIFFRTGVRSTEPRSINRVPRSASPSLLPVFIGAAALAGWYFSSLIPVLVIGLGYSLILWHAAAHDRGTWAQKIAHRGGARQAATTPAPNFRSHPLFDRDLD
jgi:hypothetical protein